MNKDNKIETLYESVLEESSLSRIWQHIQEYDCAIISASRAFNDFCVNPQGNKAIGEKFSKSENHEKNRELYRILMGFDYEITKMSGVYIEGYKTSSARDVDEESFFVVNSKEHPDFYRNIIALGKKFCQDTVLLKPKNKEEAYLYGTNNSTEPGLDKQFPIGTFIGGVRSEFMSKIGGRPFTFLTKEHFDLSTRGYIFDRSKNKFLKDVNEIN